MILPILNFLHRKRLRPLLAVISSVMYFVKGYGFVKAVYYPAFRAYSYLVNGIIYLSMGPGWAYSFNYLKSLLKETYCYYYWPATGDCIVDIGAGLGEEIVVYAQLVGKNGIVHALEANPSTYGGLQFMCAENNFTQVKSHHLAIFKTDGMVTIEDDEENYLTNTINAKSGTSVAVKAVTLDTFVKENNIGRIDFLKSNIEGAEQYLIEGMKNTVGIIRNVCISCHDFRHVYHNHGAFYLTKDKVRAFLEQNGFEINIRQTGNRVVDDYIYARNTNFN